MSRLPVLKLVSAALLVVLIGCARQGDQGATAVAESAAAPAADMAASPRAASPSAKEAAVPAPVQQAGVTADQLASSANTASAPERRFIRTANARFQVKDVYAATLAIEDAVAAAQGFVVKNEISSSPHGTIRRPIGNAQMLVLSEMVTQGSLVVRVPSERTQDFLRSIARQMQFLDQREFEATDAQFDLLRQALAADRAQALQQEVQQAAQQPARTTDRVDAAQARAELLAARDEAAVARRELEDRIAFSTLTLTLEQPVQVREQTVPDTEAILRARGPGFFLRLGESLRAGWQGLLTVVVALAAVWPLWLVLGLAGWGLRWLLRARRNRQAKAAELQVPGRPG